MVRRLWRLLDARERRRVLWILPVLVISAFVEVLGVAAVLPFISVLAEPTSVFALPVIGPLLANIGTEDPGRLLRWMGLALAAVLLLANTLVIVTNWWVLRFSWSVNHALSARLLRHYLGQPYAFTLTRNTSALANKVIVEVRHLMEHGVQSWLEIVTRSAVIAALVAFLVVLDPVLAAVVFGVLGGAYATIFFFSRRYLRRIGQEVVVLGSLRLKAVNEALGGFKDLKVTGREASAFRRYDEPARRYGEVEAAQRAIAMLPRYALEAVAVGGMVVIASMMAVASGSDVAGMLPLLGAYAFAGLRLMPLMQQLFSAIAHSRFAVGSLDAIEIDFVEAASGEGELEGTPSPMSFDDVISLSHVTFAYPEGHGYVIEDVSFDLPKRSSLAFVGQTGSGKTTLVDVVLGLLVPDRGTVAVDGVVVTAERRRAYRRLFGYVPQDVYLLDDTITRNVAFGLTDDDIDMAAVRRACALAQIVEFIDEELPDGFETIVGERGVRLSGGQRQRIGIARALYHQPQVLVFDEATSALDVHTERKLYQALDAIALTHTVITIAHRLDSVAKADLVLVLDHGRVVDRGAPADVLARYALELPSAASKAAP